MKHALGSEMPVTISNVVQAGNTWFFMLTKRSSDIRIVRGKKPLSDVQLQSELAQILATFFDELNAGWTEASLLDVNHPGSNELITQITR
jgi:hypothetical protein